MRLVAFSPRLAGPAAELLGEPAIRIYHDNALSKEPGCGRTPWHHDAEHFPLATLQAVTAWIPVTAIPAYMGPLAFARGAHVRDMVADLSFDKVGTTYDAAVARRLVESDVAVDASPFAVGEVSFHSALCFHTAGPNRSTQPRRALSTTYYADGARVLESPTLVSGRWRDFLPGVEPGGLAVSMLNPLQVARRAYGPERLGGTVRPGVVPVIDSFRVHALSPQASLAYPSGPVRGTGRSESQRRRADTRGCTLDSAAHVKPEHAAGAARPWLSVEQPTVHTDRPGGRTPSAICPWTPRHAGPQRHTVTHDGTAKKRPA